MTSTNGTPTPQGNENGLVNLDPVDSCGVGLVASIANTPSREILELALTSLANIQHRGAVSANVISGDGAGITTTLPRKLMGQWVAEAASGFETATIEQKIAAKQVAVGVFFLPADPALKTAANDLIFEQIKAMGLRPIGLREVPTNSDCLGPQALANMPRIAQVFIDCSHQDTDRFERELFLIRRSIELTPKAEGLNSIYVASLSCRTLCYKAMVASSKLSELFTDLQSPDYECSACIYHQRFTTNTSPDWSQCQPFRRLAHNGQISSVRGNRNWMSTREKSYEHPFWREHRGYIQRLFSFNDSDSASLDNTVELLSLSDRSLLHSVAMLIPPAWENDPRISDEQKAFFEFHGCFCEPWDGPAAIATTDGKTVAACLDRNGLRPARYKITKDEILLVGSEAGADRIEDSRVVEKGRLAPGEMIAIDLQKRVLLRNNEIKDKLAQREPYQDWLNEHSFEFHPRRHVETDEFENVSSPEFLRHQIAAGLTQQEIGTKILPMALEAREPILPTGKTAPIAAIDNRSRPLTDYFKQRLAQVKHPAIDPVQEKLGMSLAAGLGPERNILSESPHHCRVLNLNSPILLPDDLGQLEIQSPFKIHKIDCTWERDSGTKGLQAAIRSVVQSAQLAIEQDATILLLSDRAVTEQRIAIPMLLAIGAIHHGLCQTSHRLMCSIVVETADVRDSHQLSLMFGYGATAVYPYLSYAAIAKLHAEEKLQGRVNDSFRQYQTALSRGLLGVLSETGVSILNSYQGAQIFEAIGLGPDVISTCFRHSYAHLEGVGFAEIASDCMAQHHAAFDTAEDDLSNLASSRSEEQNKNDDNFTTDLTNLLQIVPKSTGPIPLEKVEPLTDILRRFTTLDLLAISRNKRLDSHDRRINMICPRQRHDAYTIEDIAQLIYESKVVDPNSELCVELVAQTGVGGIAVGLAKSDTDSILIGGCSELDTHVGVPWEIGIAEVHQTLISTSTRNDLVLKVGGGIRNAHDAICAVILGAEEFVINIEGTLDQQRDRINAIAADVRQILARIGVSSIDEIVGQTQLLVPNELENQTHSTKAGLLDFTKLLHQPNSSFQHQSTWEKVAKTGSELETFDDRFIEQYFDTGDNEFSFDVFNTDRNIGTKIAGRLANQSISGSDKVTFSLNLNGTAGQNLGAYLEDGIQIKLTGEANDCVGKQMQGGEIAIKPSSDSVESHKNLLAGNSLLYRATAGHLFVAGQVADRFGVQNSGATAVVEGCGDHGCEGMTGGTVVILGSIGNNFAAGMTGGQAYVWDPNEQLELLINPRTVSTSALTNEDIQKLKQLVSKFQSQTQSALAKRLLSNWQHTLLSFRKVAPKQTQPAGQEPHFKRSSTGSKILTS